MKANAILAITIMVFGPCVHKNELTKASQYPRPIQHNQGNMVFSKLLKAFNQSAHDVVALFHPAATIEFPYASSLGTPGKLCVNEYFHYLDKGLANMPDINFEGVKVYEVDNNRYWAEVHGCVQIPGTGRLYAQDYVMYFTLKDGKIFFYKEYWDPTPVLKAFGSHEATQQTFNTNH